MAQHGSCEIGNKNRDDGLQFGTVLVKFKNEPEVAIRDAKYELLLNLRGQRTGNDQLGGDIVMVLDVRDGIKAEKLKEMKQAAQMVINKLSPSDRLLIVTLPSKSEKAARYMRYMNPESKALEEYIVQNLVVGGNAATNNINGALKTALNDLDHRKKVAGRSGAIILMSDDGVHNESGRATKICVDHYPVYVFCFGNGSQVLKEIATNSKDGKFNLVNPENLSEVVSECLDGILSVPVHDVNLVIKPLTSSVTKTAKITTKINKVYAGKYPQSREEQTGSVTVSFGNLYKREKRAAVVDLSLLDIANPIDINALQIFCTYRGETGILKTNPLIFRVKRRTAPTVTQSTRTYAKSVEMAKRELEGTSVTPITPKLMVEKYGPYGSQNPENYSYKFQEGESIKHVIVRYGYIVDAIEFVVAKPNGDTYTKMFGGDNENQSIKFAFKSGEKLTQFSGTYGNYKYQGNQCLIATIKIHTNLCPSGYGPFGRGMGVEHVRNFSTPLPLNGPIVGVFGRHHNYLESVGIFVKKITS
ncbi:hypothetical protein SOVF_051700 [Spinacia oleracea]|nr:hypothetical protein SOVF_051700 [Spinacia oleracea]